MMRQKHGSTGSAEKHVKEIKRKTRRKYSAEEKIMHPFPDDFFAAFDASRAG